MTTVVAVSIRNNDLCASTNDTIALRITTAYTATSSERYDLRLFVSGDSLGLALADVLRGVRSVLVASTDLSHFYPAEVARRFDTEMLSRIAAFDPAAVLAAEDEGVGFACGRAAAAAVLWAAGELGADCAQVLRYATSGDVTRDHTSVVGYGAVALCRRGS